MRNISNQKIFRTGYALIAVVTFLLVACAGVIYLREEKVTAIEEANLDLSMIVELKASQLVQWRKERLVDANLISTNPLIAHRIRDFLDYASRKAPRDEISRWLQSQLNVSGQRALYLFAPDGTEINIVPERQVYPQQHYRKLIDSAVRYKKVVMSDFRKDDVSGTIAIDITVPVICAVNGCDTCVAVLIIDVNPYLTLYPMLRFWPAPSRSGETVMVRQEGEDSLVLNELRYKEGASVSLRVPLSDETRIEAVAATGREGVCEGIDYRGMQVLSAIRSIPDSPWVILAKIDAAEALENVRERVWYVVTICVVLATAMVLAMFLWWRRKRENLLFAQYEAEVRHSSELKKAECALQEANSGLEKKIELRTGELSSAVSRLKQEVAERKQVEEILRKQFQAILQSPVAIVITGLDGTIEFVNPKFTEYSGYSYDEAIGQNPRILKAGTTPPEFYCSLWATIASGNIWEGELCNRRKNGEIYWEYSKILPIRNQDGEITNYMAFKDDITEHKQLEEKLIQSRKLETIGQIAGGVAHEVRNPLNAILSITEALFKEKEIEENEEFVPYVQHIRTQVGRLAHLMNELLDLGNKIPTSNIQSVPLAPVCREALELWEASGTQNGCAVLLLSDDESGDGSGSVLIDKGRFVQILINLLDNAAQHSPKNSRITLELRYCAENPICPGMAAVSIADSGSGIPPDRLGRVFDPFFTSRKGGVGLGLALVKHFIEDMNGTVILSNNIPGPGCTAVIHIPKAGRTTFET